jgi:microcystin-dependent protein
MKTTSTPPAARIAALAAALALLAIPVRAETVTIASAADWAAFANRVNAGETKLDAKMTANVSLWLDAPFVGDAEGHAYAGHFDGDGHTLTVNWRFIDGTEHVAPFRFADACNIQNLHVAGSLESNGKFVAGFIGACLANQNAFYTYIRNCRSSATIACTLSGDATSAGFVAHLANNGRAKVQFNDCLFDGSLLGPAANCCGGFTGYRPTPAYARYYDCLFAPAAVTISDYDSYTFSRGGKDSLSNCYYTQAFGDTQGGTDASALAPEDLASALGKSWTVVNGRVAHSLFPSWSTSAEAFSAGFTYQGALKAISGEPLTGEKTVEFRLYDQATGGTPLWARRCTVLLDDRGLFNIGLSDGTGEPLEGTSSSDPLAAIVALSSGSTLYVGLTVSGSDGETVPRQRLLSVPYAVFATDSANASGDFAVAGRLFAAGLGVSDNATLSGNAGFKGATAVKGNLGVSGTVSGHGSAPVGAIVLWSGNSGQIPDGWALCNGQTVNGRTTPDLCDRFVVGAGQNYAPGATGGVAGFTLSEAQIPPHTHLYSGDDHLDIIPPGSTNYKAGDNIQETTGGYDAVSDNTGNARIYRTSAVGDASNHPVDIRPPYYALCYIMRVK